MSLRLLEGGDGWIIVTNGGGDIDYNMDDGGMQGTWLLRQEGPAPDGLGVGRDEAGADLDDGVHPPPSRSSMSTCHTHITYNLHLGSQGQDRDKR